MIIIGGSPSTGSSLLVRMLDRHSKISSGSESYLFTHPSLFTNWETQKKKILNSGKVSGLKSIGWMRLNGLPLLNEDYGWSEIELEQLIVQSADIESFAEAYFQRKMHRDGKQLWIEKTPSNTLGFVHFLNQDSKNKTIHITRNPYDTIASVIGRGYCEWAAVGAYVINTAMALRVATNNHHQFSYESLINSTEATLQSLCNFIGVDFEPEMIPSQSNAKSVKLPSWRHSENGPIAKSAKGKFDELSYEAQSKIIQAMNSFEIKAKFAKKHQLTHLNCQAICETIGYTFTPVKKSNSNFLKGQKLMDWWKRTYRLYPTGWWSYPAFIK